MHFPGLDIDVAGQDVVEDYILDEVVAVILLVIILLDAGQCHSQNAAVPGSHFVRALHKDRKLRLGLGTERLVGISIPHKQILIFPHVQHEIFTGLPDASEIAAGDNGSSIVHNADHTVDGIPHLVDNALE